MTYEQQQLFEGFLILGVIFLLYLLRNVHPIFAWIWYVVKWFFIVLFATLLANYAKDKVKEWWKS